MGLQIPLTDRSFCTFNKHIPDDGGLITRLSKSFEEYAYEQDGIDYWLARELHELPGYADWRNFLNAVDKAKESSKTSGELVSDHFVDVTKKVKIGSGHCNI
jgi:DNA-damage-inducible protein D